MLKVIHLLVSLRHFWLKLTVVVYPFVLWRDWINGIPVLDNFSVCNTKEIVERDVVVTEVTLAYAKHKASFGEQAMNLVVSSCLVIAGERFTKGRQAILHVRVVLNIAF